MWACAFHTKVTLQAHRAGPSYLLLYDINVCTNGIVTIKTYLKHAVAIFTISNSAIDEYLPQLPGHLPPIRSGSCPS